MEEYNAVNPTYILTAQFSDYRRQEVSDMIRSGAIRGDGTNNFALCYDALQAALAA